MTNKKQTIVKQGAVSEVMLHLSKLPTREKDPMNPVTLPELFRTKEYATEIDNALKKGYSFDDLAAIFTERCGVKVTARQLKYHCTREKNLRAKGRKSKRVGASKVAESAAEVSPQTSAPTPQSAAPISSNMATTAPATGDFAIDGHRQSD